MSAEVISTLVDSTDEDEAFEQIEARLVDVGLALLT